MNRQVGNNVNSEVVFSSWSIVTTIFLYVTQKTIFSLMYCVGMRELATFTFTPIDFVICKEMEVTSNTKKVLPASMWQPCPTCHMIGDGLLQLQIKDWFVLNPSSSSLCLCQSDHGSRGNDNGENKIKPAPLDHRWWIAVLSLVVTAKQKGCVRGWMSLTSGSKIALLSLPRRNWLVFYPQNQIPSTAWK